jgi:hypothetical protein
MTNQVATISSPEPAPRRSVLFLSHATPDDNAFVLWLGARLTALGYEVWADILDLLGGQDWTAELEAALKDRAAKMLLVATPTGVAKRGVVREIKIAQQVSAKIKDDAFIIPLRKERFDLTFDTALAQHIDFVDNWGRGLVDLIETLESYGIPRSTSERPGVSSAWQSLIASGRAPTEAKPEPLVSNALPIMKMPERVGFYRIARSSPAAAAGTLSTLTLPHCRVGDLLIGFCAARDYIEQSEGALSFDILNEVPTAEFEQQGFPAANIAGIDARRHLVSLLRQHWNAYCQGMTLQSFEFAGKSLSRWPTLERVGESMLPYPSPLGGLGRRQLVGSTYQLKWHYGVTAIPRLGTAASFTLVNRVIFTTDGQNPVADARRMHRLRRSRCKSWRNDRWRDLVLAFAHWLADGSPTINLPCGSRPPIEVAAQPRIYSSAMRLLVADAEAEPEPDETNEDNDDID